RWVRELAGVSLQDVEARLANVEGRVLGKRRRPVLFTHQGASGPGAMDLSVPVARAEAEARGKGSRAPLHHLFLDLVPDLNREALRALLVEAAGRPGAPSLARVLPGSIAKRVIEAVAVQAGLGPIDPRVNGLDK